MAEIPLRSYLHEIEKHIESGRTDQAIAHSRHILQSFPKYVDAYRLLAKAYLESQKYTDANDIFQRVLSSAPDDFVSHVGMSIIREDEGNLDEAIWHMERAFEVQPSNNAIQEELRRLFGRRDNVEPPKIRLTRGALARLYFKGELFQQAIGEIRAALGENPDRLDLQTMLAEIYLKTDQKVDAADTALAILRRLPYCVSAILVMIQILEGTDREMELRSYKQRFVQLDPYSSFLQPGESNLESVPDRSVQIEKLEWKPDQAISSQNQPAWAASLGVDLRDLSNADAGNLPLWLENTGDAEEPPESMLLPDSFMQEEEPITNFMGTSAPIPDFGAEEEVPDWLVDAGWKATAAAGSVISQELPNETFESGDGTGEQVQDSDIPDWLRAMAPPEGELSTEEGSDEFNPWLAELLPPEKNREETHSQEEPHSGEADYPDWLIAAGTAAIGSTEVATRADADETIKPEEKSSSAVAIESITEADAALSRDIQNEPTEQNTQIEEPSFGLESADSFMEIRDTKDEVGTGTEAEGAALIAPLFLKEALDQGEVNWEEMPGESQKENIESPPEAVPALEGLDDWLLELQAESQGDEVLAAATTQAVESSQDLPDWLKSLPEEEEEASSAEFRVDSDVSGWVMDEDGPIEIGEPEAEPATEIPDWLLEMKEPLDPSDQLILPNLEGDISREAIESGEPVFQDEISEDTQPTRVHPIVVEAAATQHFISDQSPFSAAEEETVIASLPTQDESANNKPEMAAAFAWLMGFHESESQAPTKVIPEGQQAAEVPFERADFEELLPIESEIPPEIPLPILTEENHAFADLEAQVNPLEPESERISLDGEEIEEYRVDLEKSEQESPSEEMVGTPTTEQTPGGSELTDQEAAFAWLETLAVRQGATEALLTNPEDRLEEMPDWVKQDALAAQMASELSKVESTEEELVDEVIAADESDILGDDLTIDADEDATLRYEQAAGVDEAYPIKADNEIPELPDWLAEPVAGESENSDMPDVSIPAEKLNLNEASLSELERLPGVGFITALKISDYREAHGIFQTVEELMNVPGIDSATADAIQNYIYVEFPEKKEAPAPDEKPADAAIWLRETRSLSLELSTAREALRSGNLHRAMEEYGQLIQVNQNLTQIAQDLEETSQSYPNEVDVWQNLGDVYLRLNRVQEALQAFIKAEQLLG